MAIEDVIKAARRLIEGNISSRRALFVLLVISAAVLYGGPSVLRWITSSQRSSAPRPLHSNTPGDLYPECITQLLYQFEGELARLDSVVSHVPPTPQDHQHVPYVGNGHVAMVARADSPLYIREQRTLNQTVPFLPVFTVELDAPQTPPHEAELVQYPVGMVQRLVCYPMPPGDRHLDITSKYVAHRTLPGVLVQEMKVRNPTTQDRILEVAQRGVSRWTGAVVRRASVVHGQDSHPYVVATGTVITADGKHMAVVVVSSTLDASVTVKASSIMTLRCLTAVNYTAPANSAQAAHNLMIKTKLEQQVIATYTEAVSEDPSRLLTTHTDAWKQLWTSGFAISHSLANDVINGDVVNATLYYVMSQARAPLHEQITDHAVLPGARAALWYTEGCYGDKIHTIQAQRLWSPLRTVTDVHNIANLWMLLLEKKGCHNMLGAGADGVMQAMVLSMGALRFSNQHLEFGMEPKDMHRDYTFRRVNFGNGTHVTLRVEVDDDNKAWLLVSLDRSDRSYFGCDAGCLDTPVRLGPEVTQFPVKLTDPPTPVLYITSDWQHLEELKHTIHVKEVNIAPAHDHHLMALHRHGHALGGLPTFFWVSIFLLIGVFHLFLIKLIINEYFGSQEKYRSRKYSDYR